MTLEWTWILIKLFVFISLMQSATEYMLLARESLQRIFLGAFYLLGAMIVISPVSPQVSFIPLLILIGNTLYWRRPFNGGSDQMLFLLLFVIFIRDSFVTPSSLEDLGVIKFLAIVSCFSYFISGMTKLRSEEWRENLVITWSLNLSCYRDIKFSPSKNSNLLMIGLQVLFPISLLSKPLAVAFLIFGMLFHFTVARVYGLNRFPWVWMATYPAIYLVASQ